MSSPNHFTWERVSPKTQKIQNSLNNLRFPKSKKELKRYLGFVIYYRKYIPRIADKLNPFYNLLKAEVPINITSQMKKKLSFSKQSTEFCLRKSSATTNSWKAACLNDRNKLHKRRLCPRDWNNPDQKIQSKRKTYAPVAFGWKIFSSAKLKMSIYSKELLAICKAILDFAHILWETTKPTTVLKENKLVTRLFQTKAIPPCLWNARDYVLQFNFKIADTAGTVKTAADSLYRLELKVTEKIRLKIRQDVETTPIQVTTSSSDVADEEHFSFAQTDYED